MEESPFTIGKLIENMNAFAVEQGVTLLCFEYKGQENKTDEEISELINRGECFSELIQSTIQSQLSFILGEKLFCWANKGGDWIWIFSKRTNLAQISRKNDTTIWGYIDKVLMGIVDGDDTKFKSRSVSRILAAIFILFEKNEIIVHAKNFATKIMASDPMEQIADDILCKWVMEQGKESHAIGGQDVGLTLSREESYMLLWLITFYLLEQVNIDAYSQDNKYRSEEKVKAIKANKVQNSNTIKTCIEELLSQGDSERKNNPSQQEATVIRQERRSGGGTVGKMVGQKKPFVFLDEWVSALRSAQSENGFFAVVKDIAYEMIRNRVSVQAIIEQLVGFIFPDVDKDILESAAKRDRRIIPSMYFVVIMIYCQGLGCFDRRLYEGSLKSNIETIENILNGTEIST